MVLYGERSHATRDVVPSESEPNRFLVSHRPLIERIIEKSKYDLRRYASDLLEKGGEEPDQSSHRFRQHSRHRYGRLLIFLSAVACICILPLLIYTTVRLGQLGLHPGIDAIISHWGFPGSPTAPLATWPTNFTRDITPKAIHSHNDYWRKVPLYDAIRIGARGIEADVWLSDIDDGNAKRQDLLSLYVNPLVDILERQNPNTSTLGNEYINNSSTTFQGVYDTSPSTSLILLIDIKSDTHTTFPLVLQQLDPLRARNWLTYYDLTTHTLIPRPITAVLTGNTLFSQVLSPPHPPSQPPSRRDVFFDAPLAHLSSPSDNPSTNTYKYNTTNSLYASASFTKSISRVSWLKGLSNEQAGKVDGQIRAAEARGLVSRYWDTPGWPVGTREALWRALVERGVGVLNVDHLRGAAEGRW